MVFTSKDLFNSIVFLMIFSLVITLTYLNLGAPDVAITEAAVGVAISTILFLVTVLVVGSEIKKKRNKVLIAFAVLVGAIFMIFIMLYLDLPILGDIASSLHKGSGNHYIQYSYDEIAVPNIVTAVLASYRSFDTLGEVFVVFVAGVAVAYVLGNVIKAKNAK